MHTHVDNNSLCICKIMAMSFARVSFEHRVIHFSQIGTHNAQQKTINIPEVNYSGPGYGAMVIWKYYVNRM